MRLDVDTSRELFRTADHAVLGVNDADGPPLLVPITFALVTDGGGTHVVFAVDHKPKTTTRLRRLALIRTDPRVAVLAEWYDEDWRRLRWVRADGRAGVLPADVPDAARDAALEALAVRYRAYRERPPEGDVVRVTVERWTGWSGEDLGPAG